MGEIVPIEKAATDMRAFFNARKGAIGAALAKVGVTPDRIIQALWTAAEKTPDLYRCEVRSVYKAMLLSAQSGLIPDGITQHAHLIPRKNSKKGNILECNLQIGYRGYLVLCRRSGQVTVIKGTLVRAGDKFKEYRGTEDRVEHEPLSTILGEDGQPRPITHAYAIAKFKDGAVDFEVMPVEEIEQLRLRSGAYADGPWTSDYGEMCKKTVMRRLCKRLPQSEDAARLLELDAQAEGGRAQEINIPVPPPDDVTGAKRADATVTDAKPVPPSISNFDAEESRRLDAEAAKNS